MNRKLLNDQWPLKRTMVHRHVVRIVCFLSILLTSSSCVLAHEYRLYIGTYTRNGEGGIYTCRFDAVGGDLWSLELAAKTENPSFLAVDPPGRYLYAVNEVDTFQNMRAGAISVFAIDRPTGDLSPIQKVSSLGSGPAHISLDHLYHFVMVANYGDGSAAVFPVRSDGLLDPYSAFVRDTGSSVNQERQAGPHAHFIHVTEDNATALVADLGADKIFMYAFDASNGSLKPGAMPYVSAETGAGPRHLAFAPDGKNVYALNELTSTVALFRYDAGSVTAGGDSARGAAIEKGQSVSTLPPGHRGANTAAEIALDAEGRYLYASNRGDDSIVRFRIDRETGELSEPVWVASGGKAPRYFCIDPTGGWLFVANQNSDNVTMFAIDPANGLLEATAEVLSVKSPVCIQFIRVN